MHNTNRSGFLVPPHPDVSEKTYHRVLARLAAEEQLRTRRLIKRSERVAALTAEYRGLVETLMGKGKYARLRQFLVEARARESRQLAPPKGLDLPRAAIEQLAATRREEGDACLRKLGTTPDALAALTRRFQARMQKAMRLPQARAADHGHVVEHKDVPAAIRNHKTNPWTIRTPPFDGFNWFFFLTQTGDTLTYIDQGGIAPFGPIWFDPVTGSVGSDTDVVGDVRLNHNYVIHGSNADIAAVNVRTYTSVGFWYLMDQATLHEAQRGGQLEVWVEMQANATQHRIDLYPYAGWETAWVDQNNFITLRATGEGDAEAPLDLGNQALVSRMVAQTGGGILHTAPEIHWNNSYFEPGATCWTHHISPNTFAANQPMWIQIGMETAMDVSVGQVQTDSDMQFDWLIKSVQLRARRPD